jgi:hypothetical protein
MSNPIPSALALTTVPDSSLITSAPHRNNYAAVQTAVNALIAALSGGSAGQRLAAVDGTDVVWSATGLLSSTRIINPTTSYTSPAGATTLMTTAVGSGGAGGGTPATGAGAAASGGGGGGGSASLTPVVANIGTHTVAVAVGGTGVAGATGNSGASSTFKDSTATIVTQGDGGFGGVVGIAGTNFVVNGSVGATTGTGLFVAAGAAGQHGVMQSITNFISGAGGAAGNGCGGAGCRANSSGAGSAAILGGGGGAGAAAGVSQGTFAGGNGGNGVILVIAYG